MKLFNYLLSLVLIVAGTSAYAGTTKSTTTQTSNDGRIILTKDNSVTMNDEIDYDTTAKLLLEVKQLDARLKSKEPIYLVLNTPGGSIDAGIEMVERLKHINRPVHTISLFSASMGFQTAQGLGTRYVTTDGTMMSHKARGGFSGEFPGQLDSRYSYYLKRVARLDANVVKRTNGKHTTKSYANLIENEYWCDGQDCVDQGFADSVATATCDKSLDGTKTETLKLFFFGNRITVNLVSDACPLNTGIVDVDISVNGVKLFRDNDKETYYYYDDENKVNLTKEQFVLLEERIKKIVDKRTLRNSNSVVKY